MQIQILIVDDLKTNRLQTRSLLQGQDFGIDEATDGVEALEKIRANRPHLVMMDIMMPNMDGITCCRMVKSDQELSNTKIMMSTTESEYEKIAEAFKAGCDDYVIKPLKKDQLLQKVEEMSVFIRLRQKISDCARP